MPVVEVRTHRISAPLHSPFVTALRTATAVETLLVEIIDEDGRSGFGEAPQVWQVTGASLAGSQSCVAEMLAPRLLGRDPDDLVSNCQIVARSVAGNEAAKCAADVALHDLAARRLGLPLVRLLGGTSLRVPTDVTITAGARAANPTGGDLVALAQAAADRVAEGFDILKIKVGAHPATDVARVVAIRERVGPRVRLRLDANQGWTPREAVRIISDLEDQDIEFVEQPVAGWDLDALAWVSDRVRTPVLADEAVFSVRDLVEVIRRRAADMVNVKLAKCGGLTAARTLLSLAQEHGVGSIVGSMMESPVGVGAAASLVAAYGTTSVSDLDAAWWLAASPVRGGMTYDGASVRLADAPGLGVRGVCGTLDGAEQRSTMEGNDT